MAQIVIIGAGLTGLSAAYHFEKKGFYDYKIFEKEETIGGLCRSIYHEGFTFDFTGHLFHASDPYFKSFLNDIVGNEHLYTINRKSFIYSQKTYTPYPYQIHLHGLPKKTIVDCITNFAQRKQSKAQSKSFKSWVLNHFGSGLGRHFFFPYQKKIFDYNINKLTASWTNRFVPKTSLEQMISGALDDTFKPAVGYNAHFFYPKQGGIFFGIQQLARHISNPIHTSFCVKAIDLQNNVISFTNGHTEPFKQLITTMPLDQLLACLKEKSRTSLKQAVPKLLCNSVINFNLGIGHKNISKKHWIYFPEKQYPFYRIGFPHNFSEHTTPSGCSSLYGECSYLRKSTYQRKKTLNNALTEVKKVLSITDAEVITERIIDIPYAYVIYNSWRDKYVPKLLTQLKKQSVYSIGRYGGWKYASMQEAFLDGKHIADLLTVLPAQKILYQQHVTNIQKKSEKEKQKNM